MNTVVTGSLHGAQSLVSVWWALVWWALIESCSCGHGPYCVHVLFVMVRVLQVPEGSPVLFAGTLKDYEAEQLLRCWEDRRKKAVRAREGRLTPAPHSSTTPSPLSPNRSKQGTSSSSPSSSSSRGKSSPDTHRQDPVGGIGEDEESQCPICLTVMVEGESLVACESGCRNFLHHHCMAVWAADRHCQMLPLLCPLCRAPWPARSDPKLMGNSLSPNRGGNFAHKSGPESSSLTGASSSHHRPDGFSSSSQYETGTCPDRRGNPVPHGGAASSPYVGGTAYSSSHGRTAQSSSPADRGAFLYGGGRDRVDHSPSRPHNDGPRGPHSAGGGGDRGGGDRGGGYGGTQHDVSNSVTGRNGNRLLEMLPEPVYTGYTGSRRDAGNTSSCQQYGANNGNAGGNSGNNAGGNNGNNAGGNNGNNAGSNSGNNAGAGSSNYSNNNASSNINYGNNNSNYNPASGSRVSSNIPMLHHHHHHQQQQQHQQKQQQQQQQQQEQQQQPVAGSSSNGGSYSSRPTLSARYLNLNQLHRTSTAGASDHLHRPPGEGGGQPSKSVPVIRSSFAPTPSSPSSRSSRRGPTSALSASFSGSGNQRTTTGSAPRRSPMLRSHSHSNTSNPTSPHSPVDSAYSSPLLPNMSNFSPSPRHSARHRGSAMFRRSPSFSRAPYSSLNSPTNGTLPSSNPLSISNPYVSSSQTNRHALIHNPLIYNPIPNPVPGLSHTPLGMPPHVGRLLPGYYPPTLRGEVSAAMVANVGDDEVPLPRSEPIPVEHEESAAAWVAVFGRELVACLFSRDWAVRETGLRRLAHEVGVRGSMEHEVVKVLHWDQLVTGEDTKKKVVHCCANILAQVVNDPVYKVYLACLRVVRVMLSYLTLSVQGEVCWLQELLRPLLHTLLLKCADGNRRTSQISVDSLLELSRGQEGELALGRDQGGSLSLGGVQYVLSCILDEAPPQEAPWQWLLGRLCVLDRLLDQFPEQFQIQMVSLQPAESGYKLQHYDRLMTVVEFAFKALGSSHATVAKLARRVYICGARMAAAEPNVFRHVCDMLGKLDISLQMRLKRRLRSLQGQRPVGFGGRSSDQAVHKLRLPVNPDRRPSFSSALPRLVRSVSHSPSRLLSQTRSPSHSPARVTQPSRPEPSPAPPSPPQLCDSEVNRRQTENQTHDDDRTTSGPGSGIEGTNIEGNDESQVQRSNEEIESNSNDENRNNEKRTNNSNEEASQEEGLETSPSLSSVKQSPPRPTHLPLDSLHMKFKDKQARVRQYHRSRPRQEEPIIVQHALITPKAVKQQHKSHAAAKHTSTAASNGASQKQAGASAGSNRAATSQSNSGSGCTNRESNPNRTDGPVEQRRNRSPLLRKGGLSQSHGNNLDLSPRTPTGPPLPNFTFKDAIASPSTPNAPFTTPVKEPTHPILSAELQSHVDSLTDDVGLHPLEGCLPKIPKLPLLPPYLAHDVAGSQERIAEETQDVYEEGKDWVRGQLLGSGAFSCCYQARDITTGTLMAVKLVSFVRNSSEEQERVEAAVEEEILLMSQLRHRNIVRLIGSVRHATSFCVFTEWMPGGSVFAMLERYGAFSELVILRYVRQVLLGLDYLHDNMILHRDLKGANLLIDSTGNWLRIGDFGTAARLASKSTVTGEFQGQLLGTLAFMAPEVLRGDDYGRACDIWSIGCCIIEMATTKPPWDADHVSNQYKLMFKVGCVLEIMFKVGCVLEIMFKVGCVLEIMFKVGCVLEIMFKIATSNGPPSVPPRLSDATRRMTLQCLQINSENRPSTKQLLCHSSFTGPPPEHSSSTQN
ncbi:Protein kinase domain [Trinorchestia longiramus]|nr:Protein kinase domain [Trinorchestia longiramus]